MSLNVDRILEEVTSDCFWVPDHVEVVQREAIKYVHSPESNILYNRVLWVRPEKADLATLVREVLEAHEGGESRWMLTPSSDVPRLRELLRDAGYQAGNVHHAYSIASDDYDRSAPEFEVRRVRSVADLRLLYEVTADAFDRPNVQTDEQLERELRHCLGPAPRVARFVAYREGEPAGTGGMTFFDDAGFALIWAGGVRPEHRGHGVYTALLAARAQAARAREIGRLGLYARVETSAPIVAAHGFERHGHLVYFERTLEAQ